MTLEQSNTSYVILSSDKLNDMVSILYAKDYHVIPIKGYYRGQYEDSVIAFSQVDNNDELRKDILFLLNQFQQECAIVKYFGETSAKKIFSDHMIVFSIENRNHIIQFI